MTTFSISIPKRIGATTSFSFWPRLAAGNSVRPYAWPTRWMGGTGMGRFIEGEDRQQVTLLPGVPGRLHRRGQPGAGRRRVRRASSTCTSWASKVRCRRRPAAPSYHPAVLLKLYIYGYLNRIQSSRRLERECQRNVELMWLTGRLAPDFKTIADFRRDNGAGHPQRVPPLRRAVPGARSCSRRPSWPSTAASSRPSTAATATSRPARSTGASSRSNRASSATSMRWRRPTARSRRSSRPRPSGCRTRSRRCASRCAELEPDQGAALTREPDGAAVADRSAMRAR